jgi:hypothetical protein
LGNLAAPTNSPFEWFNPFRGAPQRTPPDPKQGGPDEDPAAGTQFERGGSGHDLHWVTKWKPASSGMNHACRDGRGFPGFVFESAGARKELLKAVFAVDEAS